MFFVYEENRRPTAAPGCNYWANRERSYRYYGSHGKDLPEIYQAVIDTLKERQKKYEPLPVGPPVPVHR